MILVSGGPDEYSRLVVRHLRVHRPAEQIVLLVDSTQVGQVDDPDVVVRSVGVDDPAFAAGFAGADRVLITTGTAGHATREQIRRIGAAVDAAAEVGARRIAYVSVSNAEYTDLKWHHGYENRVRSTGIPYTILRNALHSEALLPAVGLALRTGELVCAAGDRQLAFGSRPDYAEAAAVALVDDEHAGQTYELTGVIPLKPLGIAAVVSAIAGRQIPLRAVEHWAVAGERGAADSPARSLRSCGNRTPQPGMATGTLPGRRCHDCWAAPRSRWRRHCGPAWAPPRYPSSGPHRAFR